MTGTPPAPPGFSRPAVWAPGAGAVELVLEDGATSMSAHDGGWWHAGAPLPAGARYRFALDGGEPLADPRALRLPDGPEGPAEVVDLSAHAWSDGGWRGVELSGAVIYELHVGTFTPEGTLDSAVGRLDHLVDLGVDLVEVMPLASFPGRHGWGYDGVGLFAVHEPYGGPYAFQRFVDACHARGLGVCLDVVYNHLGPSGNRLPEFGPYFTDHYRTPWGSAVNLDRAGSDEVRRFIIDNALGWLRDFHVDALRLDAVHALYDERALPLLEELSTAVDALADELGRPLSLIAESDRNDPGTVTPRGAGGLGLTAQWADDVHHALHVLLTGETQGYYGDFASSGALVKVLTGVFLHDGTWSSFRGRTHGRPVDRERTPGWRFVASLQTHDQVGNRATGDRLSATLDTGTLACGAALLLCAATTPMLFMGEEWGASTPWQYFTDHPDPELAEAVRQGRRHEFASHGWDREDVPDPQSPDTVHRSRLDWSEPTREPHARLLAWYRNLIRLRRERPDLRDPRLDRVRVTSDDPARTVLVQRGGHAVAVNVGDASAALHLPAPGTEVLLAWEAPTTVDRGVLSLPPRSAAVLGPA
ncbi:MAG: malto-oligosyltrehalose trehalohydrolase [Nocardioidaceae bacterium]|nr:malto-oligosyltrehalose trehalohydrolase [Nocardioidaceae bacterium]